MTLTAIFSVDALLSKLKLIRDRFNGPSEQCIDFKKSFGSGSTQRLFRHQGNI